MAYRFRSEARKSASPQPDTPGKPRKNGPVRELSSSFHIGSWRSLSKPSRKSPRASASKASFTMCLQSNVVVQWKSESTRHCPSSAAARVTGVEDNVGKPPPSTAQGTGEVLLADFRPSHRSFCQGHHCAVQDFPTLTRVARGVAPGGVGGRSVAGSGGGKAGRGAGRKCLVDARREAVSDWGGVAVRRVARRAGISRLAAGGAGRGARGWRRRCRAGTCGRRRRGFRRRGGWRRRRRGRCC